MVVCRKTGETVCVNRSRIAKVAIANTRRILFRLPALTRDWMTKRTVKYENTGIYKDSITNQEILGTTLLHEHGSDEISVRGIIRQSGVS